MSTKMERFHKLIARQAEEIEELKQQLASSNREGWEDAKEKCVKISMGMFDCNGEEVANAIAAMEYKEG